MKMRNKLQRGNGLIKREEALMRKAHFLTGLRVLATALVFLVLQLAWGTFGSQEARGDWRTEWDKTVQAARREGQLVLHVSESYDPIFREFQKKFPEIKVITVSGRGSQIAQRVLAERRAGKFLADLYMSGSGTPYRHFYQRGILDPIKPVLLLPEVVDKSKWWRGEHFYHDDEGKYILAFNGVPQSYFAYNTNLVNPKEIKSYWDFLDPKWKGKIVSLDPTMGGAVSGVLTFIYHNPQLGEKFLRRFLTEMDLTATRDGRQLVNWLAVGKFSISALAPPDRVGIYDAQKQGLPVNIFDSRNFKEGIPLSTSSGNMAFFNKAPHPNAAKLAINWLLSREGQIIYQKVNLDKNSLRIDIPKDQYVLPHVRREKGVDYQILAGPGLKDMGSVMKVIREVWKGQKSRR